MYTPHSPGLIIAAIAIVCMFIEINACKPSKQWVKCKSLAHTTFWVGWLYSYLPNGTYCLPYCIFCSYHPTGHHILHISIRYKYPSQVGPSPLWGGRHSGIYSVLDRASRTGWRFGDHNISLPHYCWTFPSNWLQHCCTSECSAWRYEQHSSPGIHFTWR